MPSRVKFKVPRKRGWLETTIGWATFVVSVAACIITAVVVMNIGPEEAAGRIAVAIRGLSIIHQP